MLHRQSIGKLALLATALAVLAAAPAGAKTYAVSGKQTVVNEDKGTYKMRGGLIGRWTITSFEEVAQTPYYQARGTEKFKGCLDRRRDRSCKGDPSGTLSFTFEYWAQFTAAEQPALVWGACWHPIVGGTGDFSGAAGVLVMADTPTSSGVKTAYTGNVTLKGKSAHRSRTLASASRVAGCVARG